MNDRLKFRVWDIEEKTYKSSDCPFFLCDDGKVLDTHFDIRDNEVIVEQCTGLKDKNGKLVYEGDICRISGTYYCCESDEELGVDTIEIVESLERFFAEAMIKSIYSALGCDTLKVEIIGNVRENPDLLKNPGNFNVSGENVKGDNR